MVEFIKSVDVKVATDLSVGIKLSHSPYGSLGGRSLLSVCSYQIITKKLK